MHPGIIQILIPCKMSIQHLLCRYNRHTQSFFTVTWIDKTVWELNKSYLTGSGRCLISVLILSVYQYLRHLSHYTRYTSKSIIKGWLSWNKKITCHDTVAISLVVEVGPIVEPKKERSSRIIYLKVKKVKRRILMTANFR